ncbi:MAG: Hpt domain-containing protein [Candidatus Cyclobacteriaceae bacterium M2_1C_046]
MIYTNLNYLNDFTDGDPELMKAAVSRYLKSSPKLLKKLNENYENGNWEQVAFVAHSLYSSTQIVGIVSIAEPLQILQKNFKENPNNINKEETDAYINEINKAIKGSHSELSTYK